MNRQINVGDAIKHSSLQVGHYTVKRIDDKGRIRVDSSKMTYRHDDLQWDNDLNAWTRTKKTP